MAHEGAVLGAPSRKTGRVVNAGIELSLQALARSAMARSKNEIFCRLAHEATADVNGIPQKMRALNDIFHRLTGHESYMDADDACLNVATLALTLGIPCRFIAQRWAKHSWTVVLGYEVDGHWEKIECTSPELAATGEPHEEFFGEELRP